MERDIEDCLSKNTLVPFDNHLVSHLQKPRDHFYDLDNSDPQVNFLRLVFNSVSVIPINTLCFYATTLRCEDKEKIIKMAQLYWNGFELEIPVPPNLRKALLRMSKDELMTFLDSSPAFPHPIDKNIIYYKVFYSKLI